MHNIKILDCTFRDGGHLNNWHFDNAMVKDVYRAVSKAGVDYFEIGYMNSSEALSAKEYGKWWFSRETDIRNVIGEIKDAKLAVMIDTGKASVKDIPNKKYSIVDAVRVATYYDGLDEAIISASKILDKGYEVFLNLMAINKYTAPQIKELKKKIMRSPIKNIYFADSFGSFLPTSVGRIADTFVEMKGRTIGFHAHNNLQMAFANTLVAIEHGVTYVDATIYGMGRAAGNMPLEMFIGYMQELKKERYNVVPVLEVIERYFVNLRRKLEWGYSLPYLLSGFWACHPNYGKEALAVKEYLIEDIWNMMKKVSEDPGSGYSPKLLKNIMTFGTGSSKKVSRHSWINISAKNVAKNKNSVLCPTLKKVEYIGRHTGKDFLVLANGPMLKEYKLSLDKLIKKHDPIILGANYLGNLFLPHYHAFTNKKRFIKYISKVHPKSRLLINSEFEKSFIQDYTQRAYELIYHNTDNNGLFNIKGCLITTGYYTVSILLILIAHLMGGRRILVAGMDGYKDIGDKNIHFYNEEDETGTIEMGMGKHKSCSLLLKNIRRYLINNGREEFHIITPTSYGSHYRGIKNYI